MSALLVATCLAAPALAFELRDLVFADVAFASLDVDGPSVFAASGAKRGFSLPVEGARRFILSSSGTSLSDTRRVRSGKLLPTEVDRQGRVIFGLERSDGPVFAAVGLGPAVAQIRNRWGGGHIAYGVAFNADLWIRPAEDLYVALNTAADTASQNWWNRARIGYRFAGLPFALGPEVVASVARTSGKFKLGLHIGEASLWRFTFDASGGVMWDHDRRPAGYLSLSTYVRF